MRSEPLDIQAIRARADAASEGPWRPELQGSPTLYGVRAGYGDEMAIIADCWQGEDDSVFIAASRADVLALCDELERLRVEHELADDSVAIIDAYWDNIGGRPEDAV